MVCVDAKDSVLWERELNCPYYYEEGEGCQENISRSAFSLVEGEGDNHGGRPSRVFGVCPLCCSEVGPQCFENIPSTK